MATTAEKHSLDTVQNILPATKQRKLDEVKETMDMDDHMYDIQVKLYSDAKAARKDPKQSLEEFEDEFYEDINSFAYSKHPAHKLGWTEDAGVCNGKLIRRDRMRPAFHQEIEDPSEETSLMGFDLFDRYGRLKPEFKDHPIKKGSGIWGKELNYGDILLIEKIQVQKSHRRHGLGSKLVTAILEKTCNNTESFVAITRPASLVSETEREISGVTNQERRAIIDRENRIAILFWRSMGFRRIGSSDWFALAGARSHPCHTLPAADDYDPPAAAPRTKFPDIKPLFKSLKKLEDTECLKVLQDTLQNHASGEPQWAATDRGGNTLLHTAGLNSKPECVKWIMHECQQLAQVRNHEGYTPLEALQSHLERVRTQYTIMDIVQPISDEFSGFSDAFVACSALLRGQTDVQRDELLRLKYGCTCGECISGFLSPRMHLVLLTLAEKIQHDMFLDKQDVKSNNDLTMRQGFMIMWDHTATCLRKKVLPTEFNVLEDMRDASEWPFVTRNYLQRRRTVKAVASMLFKKAMDQDKWSGDGEFSEVFGDEVKELPKCRNDHEFGFVSGMCGYKRVSQNRFAVPFTGEDD
ncbi:hypothetical protein F4819DRAFT_306770 [Hypoxylon fuscum]|nr:hypothetical protein F4819DRAFT_306770 [Hypoxylon fuscum]